MKIYQLEKPLNPDAEEWRPASQPPHHLPLSIVQTPPPPKLHLQQLPYLHYFYIYVPQQQPMYSISFPAVQIPLKAAAEASTPLLHDIAEHSQSQSQQENSFSDDEKKTVTPAAESPKHPRDYTMKKGSRRALPPRLRRASRDVKQPQPPPPPKQQRWHNESHHGGATFSKVHALDQHLKQEWKPKNKAHSNLQVSGVGGAASSLPPSSSKPKSTVMIKNIPSQLRRDNMLDFLDGCCRRYSVEYDFLYLPIDFRRLGNLGYAFVNFTTEADAFKFKNVMNNYKWRIFYTKDGNSITSNKICDIKWARIQGKEALIRRFERSSFNCKELEFLPAVLEPPRNGSDRNPPPPVNLGRISISL